MTELYAAVNPEVDGDHPVLRLPFAYALASRHFHNAVEQMATLQGLTEKLQPSEAIDIVEQSTRIAAICTSLSLAAEMGIKAMLLQEAARLQSGHDLLSLFGKLSNASKDALQKAFFESRARNPAASYGTWIAGKGKITPSTEPSTFTEVLNELKDTFTEKRYLYESLIRNETIFLPLRDLACLADATVMCIKSYRGQWRIHRDFPQTFRGVRI